MRGEVLLRRGERAWTRSRGMVGLNEMFD